MLDGNNLFDCQTASYHMEWCIDETFTYFYQNYRKYVVADNIFNMTTEPQRIYSTVGDLKTLSGKISVTCNADELQGLNRSSMEV